MRTDIYLLAAILCTAACDSPSRSEAVAATDSLSDMFDGSESSGGEEPSRESAGELEDPIKLDLPAGIDHACTEIDFLFVIDDSRSMEDEQARLIDGLPGFMAGVEDAIAQYDYHMMVVTTGTVFGPQASQQCETAIGAGRVASADGQPCDLAGQDSGQRFSTEADGGLADVFSCVGAVGVQGSGSEQPIWSMAQALTTHSLPGGCNEGFLRDDAILVVTIITDEEENEGDVPGQVDSPGDPELWREVLTATKHGAEEKVVVLGLLGDTDVDDGVCEPYDSATGDGAEASPRLREFVESFEYGSWASVCLDDYAPFFNDAVAEIGAACHDFVPEG